MQPRNYISFSPFPSSFRVINYSEHHLWTPQTAGVQVAGGMKGGPDFRPTDSQEIHQLSGGWGEGTFLYSLEIKTFPTFFNSLGNLSPYLMYCTSVFLRKLVMFIKHYTFLIFKTVQ